MDKYNIYNKVLSKEEIEDHVEKMCKDLKNWASVGKHAVQPARVKQNMEKNGKLEQMEKWEKSLVCLLQKPGIFKVKMCYSIRINRHTNFSNGPEIPLWVGVWT